jgi:hypothetical protein
MVTQWSWSWAVILRNSISSDHSILFCETNGVVNKLSDNIFTQEQKGGKRSLNCSNRFCLHDYCEVTISGASEEQET